MVEVHDDHFPMDATDEEWLAEVGRRGWLCLTKDVRIGLSTLQRLWVAKHGVKLFVFRSGNMTGSEMGEALAKALPRVGRVAERNAAPLIAKVYASGGIKLWRDRVALTKELAKQQGR
jgi:predicted nuclease of predicted toxin-antitoxin system